MIEKKIYLEGVDPVKLFGINNSRFDKIKQNFPKLKIVARGNELIIKGENKEITRLEVTLNHYIDYLQRTEEPDEEQVEELLMGNGSEILANQEVSGNILLYGESGKPIRARTVNQKVLVKSCDKIILTRPAVEAGERLGFLPGDYKEKLDPYLQPLYDALNDMIPSKKLKGFLEDNTIQIAPIAFMRGRTLDHAFVILDEAQNATVNQLKMFLTRMGKNAKFIVTGDITQIDLPDKRDSGLLRAVDMLKNINGISLVYFDVRDIIRHKLVKYIVEAYGREEGKDNDEANTNNNNDKNNK